MNLFKKLASAVALSFALASVSAVPVSAVPACTVTIDQSNVTVSGTGGSDVFCITGNNVTVNLLEGNDWVIDNGANNRIYLGSGDDFVDGSGGNGSIIDGGIGNDNITGTPGIDTITGGDGDDTLVGGSADDSLSGGSGNDTIRGDAGVDTIIGEAGLDNLDGGADNDNLNGGIGDDTLIGGDGNDSMFGGDGADNLTGSAGDDNISGEAGNDIFDGGDGSDTLIGGTGDDTLVGGASGDVMNGGDGTDNLSGSAGDDNIAGEAGNDTIDGGDGNDNLTGGLANDAIVGGAGNDTITGGDGNDNLSGFTGDDFIYGESGADTLAGNAGDDVLVGGADLDTLDGGFGLNTCDYTTSETKTSTCVYDDTAPTVTASTLGSGQLETGSAATALPISVSIHDATGLGYARVTCSVSGPGGYRYQAFDFTYTLATGVFTNNQLGTAVGVLSATGTSRDVTISGTVSIRQGQYPGQYGCTGELQDVALNKATNLTIPGFEVVRTGSGFDDAAPTVSNVTFTKNPVDSGPSADQTTVHFELSDDTALDWGYFTCSLNSGNAQTRGVELGWTRTRVFDYNSSQSSQSVTVNATTRGFTIPVTVKQATPPGNYQCSVWAQDTLYNRLDRLNVGTLVVERSGTAFDDNPPTVVSVTPSASTIDIGDSAKPFSITIHMTDETAINWNYLSCSSGGQTLVNIGLGPNAVVDYSTNHAFTTGTRSGNAQDLTVVANFLVPFGFTPGLYTCGMLVMDTNGHRADPANVASFTVARTPAGMPQSPTNLTFTPTLDRPTEGTLAWVAPSVLGDPALSDYEVQYSLDGNTWRTLTDGISSTTSANLLGLTVNTNYWFRVRGDNGGNSISSSPGASWSTSLSTRTPVAAVPTAPRTPVVSAVTSASATIAWTASAYNGGSNISAFVVETSRDAGNTWRVAPATNATSTTLSVGGLAPGTSYLIRISARNAVGSSDFVTSEFRTLATLATQPLSLTATLASSTSATLSWQLPTTNGGDDITDYSVQFSSDNGAHWTSIGHEATAVRNFDVTSLSKGITYKFRVAAVNSIGIGAYSDVATLAVPAVAADAPGSLTNSSVTSSTAVLAWNLPADLGGSPVVDYQIEVSRDGGSTWTIASHSASVNRTFTITGLAPGTNYRARVSAKTGFGVGAASTHVSFTTTSTMPGVPSMAASTNVTANSLTLNWNLPGSNGGDDITDYKVEFSSNGGTTWVVIAHEASAVRNFNVTGLNRATAYRFRVSAVNSVGTGAPAAPIVVTTSAALPASISTLRTTSLTANVAALRWTAPTENGGAALSDYVVETSRDGGNTWLTVPHVASTSTALTISGLAPGTQYLVQVRAKNSVGLGPSSTLSITTTATVATKPLSLSASSVARTTLSLAWDLPASNGGTDLTNYKIEVSSNNGSTWTAIAHTISLARAFDVTGLTRATTYKFRVSAINSLGAGAASDIITVKTLSMAPNAPTNFVKTVGTTTATIGWSAPADNGGEAITDYTVAISRDSGTSWTVLEHAASTKRSFVIAGLTPGVTYPVLVQAKNRIGNSAILEGTFTTLPIVSTAPLSLDTADVTGTTLRLNWIVPVNNGGARISNYLVQVSSNGTAFTTIQHPVSDSYGFNVTNLLAGTKYWFRVAAINSVGTSAFSNVVNAVTVGATPLAPTALAVSASTTYVSLSWQAATVVGGSAIRNFVVEYSSDAGTTWRTVVKPVSTSKNLQVTGLLRSTAYKFRVFAVNDVGSSEASALLSVSTK